MTKEAFDKDIELLKITLLSDQALANYVTFTALYLGGWLSVALVTLQLFKDPLTVAVLVVAEAVATFLAWFRWLTHNLGKHKVRVGIWPKKVQNHESIGEWENLLKET